MDDKKGSAKKALTVRTSYNSANNRSETIQNKLIFSILVFLKFDFSLKVSFQKPFLDFDRPGE